MVRPRHQKSDYEYMMKCAEKAGWVFERRAKKFQGRCSSGGCLVTIPLTPSSQRTLANRQADIDRCPH
ncbi:MAG: hypothetical protein F4X48_01355 [Acidimicrobiia bacterium]|nr:hypothetical protein [Acidimicrobiia bacterium]